MTETITGMTESIVTLPIKLAFKEIKPDSAFTSKLIGAYTHSKISHVEIIIDDLWVSALVDGVHVSKITIDHNDRWAILDLGEVTISGAKYREILSWLNLQDPAEYDWTAIIFSQAIPLGIDDPYKWFCSEIVTRVLQMLGFTQVMELEPSKSTPALLGKIFRIE